MDKPKLHIVSLSGGKDSTAMLLRMLEEGMPVDIILFCDTGLEFPQLYEHIRKVEEDIGREITVVKADDDFEYLFARKKIVRKKDTLFAERYGMERDGYSWAGPKMRWCTEVLKNQPRERYLRKLREEYDVIECVGIAADETYRLERKCNQRPGVRLPLVEWGMTEAECLAYNPNFSRYFCGSAIYSSYCFFMQRPHGRYPAARAVFSSGKKTRIFS